MTIKEDCTKYFDLLKNMAARGQEQFFLFLYKEHINIILVKI